MSLGSEPGIFFLQQIDRTKSLSARGIGREEARHYLIILVKESRVLVSLRDKIREFRREQSRNESFRVGNLGKFPSLGLPIIVTTFVVQIVIFI